MSKTTTNYGLVKPELTDVADITAMNTNWDKIDTELKSTSNHLDNLEDNFIVENMLKYPYFHGTKTLNGITFTDNGDGTITLNGTNTGDNDADFAIFRGDLTLKAGTYVLSGSPEGSSVSTYFLQIADEDWSYSINSYGEKVINVSEDQVVNRVRIVVKPGVTVSSIKFKPMLEFGTIAHEYTPYTKSRQGLKEEIANAKDNLFVYPYAEKSKVLNGITFTDNGDGTILANGTATAEATFYISQDLTLKAGVYSFSGCPVNTCKIQIANRDWSFNRTDSGKGRTFTLEETKTFSQVRISIPTGVTVSNVLFKPMLVEGDTIPTKHKMYSESLKKAIAFSCGANTTVLDIVNAYNNKEIAIGERLSLGSYGNFNYSYGYGILLRAVFDQTLQAYIVKMLIWDDADETVGILYGKSTDGSMLLKDAKHNTLYHKGNPPTASDVGALPLDGSVAMTGSLFIKGLCEIAAWSTSASMTSKNVAGDSTNQRTLGLYNSTAQALATALRFIDYTSNGNTSYNIFGEHNKPSGSYTGNGSATERKIETGGISSAFIITGSNGAMVVLSSTGGIARNGTNVVALTDSEAKAFDGDIILKTTSALLNASGVTYYYRNL